MASCFVSFYSREAAEVVEARERCRATVKKVEVDKEWVRLNPNPDEKKPQASYMYIGDDNAFKAKYGLAIFSADDCSLTSFAGGEVTLYKF